MRKNRRVTWVVLAGLIPVGTLRADLVSASTTSTHSYFSALVNNNSAHGHSSLAPNAGFGGLNISVQSTGSQQPGWGVDPFVTPLGAGSIVEDEGESSASKRVIQELPGLPSSSELFLSAMLGMGAWQLVRSTKHLHLSSVPEWYHHGGPAQIGHAVPCDLQFAPAVLCIFDRPSVGVTLRPERTWADYVPIKSDQPFLRSSVALRGPPLLP